MTDKSQNQISLLGVFWSHKPPAMTRFGTPCLLTITVFSKGHIVDKSLKLTAVVKVLIMSFIWLSWQPRLCVMLADAGLVGSRPGRGLRL